MTDQKFEKRIIIEGYKPLDFTTDNGDKICMLKVSYSFNGDGVNSFGRVVKDLNFPYEFKDKLKDVSLPIAAVVEFTCEDLTKKPVLTDLKLVNTK